jgi:hypothetical protein
VERIVIPIENERARNALVAATHRLGELLRSVREADTPVPGSTWSIQEAAVHVAASLSDYGESLSGMRPLRTPNPALGPTSEQIRAVNAERMSEIGEPDLPAIAQRISSIVERFIDATEGRHGDEPYDWYGKCESTLAAMTSVMLGEVVLHGRDIARAARTSWPIDRDDGELILLGALPLLPAYVDAEAARGVRASYEIALRGGPHVGVRIRDGVGIVEYPARAPFDCRMNVDPVTMVLVSYGRIPPLRGVLRGGILAWGRKPWMGLAFARMIANP